MRILYTVVIVLLISACGVQENTPKESAKDYEKAVSLINTNMDEAERLANLSYNASLNSYDKLGIAKFAFLLGHINSAKEKYTISLDYFLEANKYFDLIGDSKNTAKALLALGFVSIEITNYDLAVKYLKKIPDLGISDKELITYLNYYLSLSYIGLEKKDSALYSLKKVELPDADPKFNSLKNRLAAYAYAKLEDYPGVIRCAEKSIALDKNNLNLASCYTSLCFASIRTNELKKAMEYNKAAMACNVELYMGSALRNAAFIHIATNDLIQAESALKHSLKSDGFSNLGEVTEAYKRIAIRYEKSGNIKKALEFHKLIDKTRDLRDKKLKELNLDAIQARQKVSNFENREIKLYASLLEDKIQLNNELDIYKLIAIVLAVSIAIRLIVKEYLRRKGTKIIANKYEKKLDYLEELRKRI